MQGQLTVESIPSGYVKARGYRWAVRKVNYTPASRDTYRRTPARLELHVDRREEQPVFRGGRWVQRLIKAELNVENEPVLNCA